MYFDNRRRRFHRCVPIRAARPRRLDVTGLDNVNAYYDPGIKENRIRMVEAAAVEGPGSFQLVRGDLADAALVERLFAEGEFDVVVNLAAQAGVRYSIDN